MIEGQVFRTKVIAAVLTLEAIAQEDIKTGEGWPAVKLHILLHCDDAGQLLVIPDGRRRARREGA